MHMWVYTSMIDRQLTGVSVHFPSMKNSEKQGGYRVVKKAREKEEKRWNETTKSWRSEISCLDL